jgi:thiamine biosynthesis lipoprotein
MSRHQIIRSFLGLVLVLVLGIGSYLRWATLENPIFWGETMGTAYSVTLTGKVTRKVRDQLSIQIETELAEINRQMSTWDPSSEISRFNKSTNTGPFQCSAPLIALVKRALELSRSTGGAFDPTLQPLLNLWGFGSEGEEHRVPSDAEIKQAKAQTGWLKLEVIEPDALKKTVPELQLALGAIAKGYGVDRISQLLNTAGFENWFVEIGGEVVVRGVNPDGIPWRIGIQYPTSNPMDTRLKGIVHLTGNAIATSGDYRNYIEEDGVIYSHILDPRSGRAVLSDTASVTVTAPTCMDADGMATALFVMGAEEGLIWVEQQPEIEAMFLVRNPAGEISEKFSSGFPARTSYTPSN